MDGWEAAYTGVQRTRDWAAREKFGELGRRELGDLLWQVGKGGSGGLGDGREEGDCGGRELLVGGHDEVPGVNH